ncbi:beta-glucoside-specific PTS transporter subunit IIABC [Paenibacillus sp. FSL K6-0276]|uniref:beta-glucoside-specific PTS transporter subunit IIABC n=1 Tax=unclassified Paenibacillus TaxID=185978 RepID=UPI0028AA5289|nr:beta-glucoside-specific PTS transporter subunit IIABC [Paenibacillus sp.]
MKYKGLAVDILREVGGRENVEALVHCATRLRFTLKDQSKANKDTLSKMEGVLSVVVSGGQFQVIIGAHVSDVYAEIVKVGKLDAGTVNEGTDVKSKESLSNRIFGIISGSFSPLLGALAGSGMLKALLIVLTTVGVLKATDPTYLILSAAGNAVFYFLPIFLGITLATKLNASPYIGGVIGAALLEPNYTGLASIEGGVSFLQIPVIVASYSATVFPIFIAVSIYALLNKVLLKIIPRSMQLFLVPMLAIIVIVPLTIIVFGPFGVYVGDGISNIILMLSEKSGWLAGAIMGSSWTFLTLLGIHNGFIPIFLQNLSQGGDPLIATLAAAPFAQLGVAAVVALRSKDKSTRSVAVSGLFPGFLGGVTEPIIYGVLFKYKRTLPYVIIAGAIGGAISGAAGVRAFAFAFPSVLSIPSFGPIVPYIISLVVSFVLAAALTYFLGYEDKKKKEQPQEITEKPVISSKNQTIFSPLTGAVKTLSEISDKAFSSGAMGKGVAIEPTVGEVVSPVDGKVTNVFPSYHAIGITSDEGIEILIHVGVNTVKLKGKYFEPVAVQGATVRKGDTLLKFDIEKIREEGFELTTPVIVTNADEYLDVVETKNSSVSKNDNLLTILV